MRIIAGRYKSRRLKARPGAGTRPTSDKLRETLFNILASRVIESVFLDGYAGVGAVGIEAASRGARSVYFVDRSVGAERAIRSNLESIAVDVPCRVLQMELNAALGVCLREGVSFDIVFLDPPYAKTDLYGRDLERLASGSLLHPGSIVVLEHARGFEWPRDGLGLARTRTLEQGDSALTFFEREDR